MDEALEALGSGKEDAQTKAKQALEEGKELIGTRQKLLKIVDCLDGGWRVAEEYQWDPVAENRDKKRIRKAKKEAERKLAKAKKEKAGKRGNFHWRKSNSPLAFQRSQLPSYPLASAGLPRPPVLAKHCLCFACGMDGHFRKDSPYYAAGASGSGAGLPNIGASSGSRL